ncbi:MAG: hypothetical protein IKU38_09395 [Clostridia bacterium]|nr:hypothetical protein [Clostridia bacterium]
MFYVLLLAGRQFSTFGAFQNSGPKYLRFHLPKMQLSSAFLGFIKIRFSFSVLGFSTLIPSFSTGFSTFLWITVDKLWIIVDNLCITLFFPVIA